MVGRPSADRWALVATGLVAATAAVDVAVADRASLGPLLVLGPLVAAFYAGPGRTALVALAALIGAGGLVLADGEWLTDQHIVQLLVVGLGGIVATLVALIRDRLEHRERETTELLAQERVARGRSEFLARVSELLEAPPVPALMLESITQLAVPQMADLCIVDEVEDGALRGVAVHAIDQTVVERVRKMRCDFPLRLAADNPHPVARVAVEGRPMLVQLDDRRIDALVEVPEQADNLKALGYRSAVVVPLRARGRTLGVMSFVRLGDDVKPYLPEDRELAVEVARKAALALDGARLFRDLSRTEGRLDAILTNLAEAVLVQDDQGGLVFANEAAADLLGFDTVEALTATAPAEIAERFSIFDEHGDPLDPERFPGRRALAGVEHPEPLLTRFIERSSGVERWVLAKARPLHERGDERIYAVTVLEDVTEARRNEREQRLLSSASKLLSSSLDLELTMEKAAWAPVPEVADFCAIHILDDRGRLERRALAADPEHLPGLDAAWTAMSEDAPDPVAVLREGRSIVLESVGDTDLQRLAVDAQGLDVLRRSAIRSLLFVPLAAGDRVIGILSLGTSTSGRRLRDTDIPLAEELGRRAGIAVENSRVHETRTMIAETLQRSLLPPRLPVVPGLAMAARFRAAGTDEAERVGGDFYDLFPAGDAWFVVIGDVTGKGPEAAAITSLARYTMRTAARYERQPARVLARLNEALAADPDRRRLCTAICMRVDAVAKDGSGVPITVACAGHPPPLRLREGAEAEPLEDVGGPLLGAFDDLEWVEADTLLAEGESLVLYTDGVTDCRGASGRFGTSRLRRLSSTLGDLEADEIAGRIDEALLEFEEGPQRDDVALLVLQAGVRHGGGAATAFSGRSDGTPVADL